ncbi:MAG: response regulator [Myxococcota bacterium]|jgi:DNA-binding response OmpR family regulator|nr:response regulator [Myxococcota bacterium]
MRKRVLIVDDTKTVLSRTASLLQDAGYEVLTRSEPLGTGGAVMREQPDLVLLDVQMPLLSGDEILRLLRDSKPELAPRVLLYSSLPTPMLAEKAAACGADGYLQKGCSPEELLERVRKALDEPSPLALPSRPPQHVENRVDAAFVLVLSELSFLPAIVGMAVSSIPSLQVRHVRSLSDALSAIAESKPSAIVLGLSDSDAYNALERLSKVCASCLPPVLMLSNDDRQDSALHACQLGVSHCLPPRRSKGCLRAALVDILKALDRNSRRHQFPVKVVLGDGSCFRCQTWDLQPSFAYLECPQTLPLETAVEVHFLDTASTLRVRAKVAQLRTCPVGPFPAGLGLSLEELDAQQRDSLSTRLNA